MISLTIKIMMVISMLMIRKVKLCHANDQNDYDDDHDDDWDGEVL